MSFHASEVAHELVGKLKPVWLRMKTTLPKLADQLVRAMSSIPLNVDEGRRRQGRDRINLWNYAAGSAGEVRSILRVAVSLGFEDPVELEPVLALLDREMAMLWRLCRAPHNRHYAEYVIMRSNSTNSWHDASLRLLRSA